MKSVGFSRQVFRKYPELLPLVGIMSGAICMASSFIAYALYTKPDVRVSKAPESPPYERVGPTESRKVGDTLKNLCDIMDRLITWNAAVYKEIPELAQLRKEIGNYKS